MAASAAGLSAVFPRFGGGTGKFDGAKAIFPPEIYVRLCGIRCKGGYFTIGMASPNHSNLFRNISSNGLFWPAMKLHRHTHLYLYYVMCLAFPFPKKDFNGGLN